MDEKYWPYFGGFVGAMDVVHLCVKVKFELQRMYRNRHVLQRRLFKFDKIQMIDYSSNRFSWFIPDDNLNSTRFKDFQTAGSAEPPGKVEIKISATVAPKDELSFSYNLLSMVGIDLSDNLLHGEIPEALFRQKNIEYLNLSYNFLEGQLPHLEKLPRLKALDLSHNSLSGQVTGNITTPSGLTLLNLSHNCFSGIITEKEGLGKFTGALAGNPELCIESSGSKCDPANIDASREEIYQNEMVEGPISIWIFCLSAFISFDFGVLGIFCSELYSSDQIVTSNRAARAKRRLID